MTEQSKVAYLQEKIQEAMRKEKRSNWILILAVIVGIVGLFFFDFKEVQITGAQITGISYPYWSLGLIILVSGITVAGIGFAELIYYGRQNHKYTAQLALMATTIQCPNCGKELPEKSIRCPVCRKLL